MKCKGFLITFLKSKKLGLRKLLKEFGNDLQEGQTGGLWSSWSKVSPDEDGKSYYESEYQLRMLLSIEQFLRRLQHRDHGRRIWEKIGMRVRKWWLHNKQDEGDLLHEKQLHMDMDRSLRMVWESKDSVWLLGFEHTCGSVVWFLSAICSVLQRHSSNLSEQYKETQENELLATFQERLDQWENRIEYHKRQYDNVWGILKYWPECNEVRIHYFRDNTRTCYSYFTVCHLSSHRYRSAFVLKCCMQFPSTKRSFYSLKLYFRYTQCYWWIDYLHSQTIKFCSIKDCSS